MQQELHFWRNYHFDNKKYNLIIWEENRTKKVPRSRERKKTELHPSQNLSNKNKVQSLNEKGKKFSSYKKEISCIDEEDEPLHNETVLPRECADRDIATDEEGNFWRLSLFSKWSGMT